MKSNLVCKIAAGIATISLLTNMATPVFAYINEETIYSKLKSDGSLSKSTVTTITENENGVTTVQDENNEELPVECTITYYLNGEKMSAKEIAGKSGRVTIKMDFVNKSEQKVMIDGKEETMYTPFIVVSGVILSQEKNKNIEVSNGKIITNGENTIAVGMAMPGMQESLNLDSSKISLPSSIEISMDTEKFETGNIMTYCTPKTFSELDISIDDFDEIFEQVDTLQSASNQLVDGTVSLKNGVAVLLSGTEKLKDGINSAYDGALTIRSAVDSSISNLSSDSGNTIDDETLASIKEQAEGAAILSNEQKESIRSQAETSATLSDEKKEEVRLQAESSATLSNEKIEEIKIQAEGAATLSNEKIEEIKSQAEAAATLSEAKKTEISQNAQAEIMKSKATIEASAEAAVRNQLGIPEDANFNDLSAEAQQMITMAKAVAVSTAQSVAGQVAVSTAESTAMQTAGNVAALVAQSTATETAGQVAALVAQSTATETAGEVAVAVAQSTATTVAEQTALQTAQTTAKQTAVQTATTVANAVGNQAKAQFTSQVASQMETLSNGLNELTNGLASLNTGAGTLLDGTSSLDNGAQTLASGMKKFNDDGIQKICDLVNNSLKNTISRVEKLEEISKDYETYASDKDKRDNIQFISMTESIKVTSSDDKKKKE
jgi:putative membrane protein